MPIVWVILSAILLLPQAALAQTATYHLHKEASTTSGLFQLKTAGPDAAATTLKSASLKNRSAGEYLIKSFDTQAGVPSLSGVIPTGSTVTFTLWMNKSANYGTMYPRAKLNLNSATGTALCTATGSTALTTTLTQYVLTCTTTANISMTTTDRLYLWAGVNLTTGPGKNIVYAQLNIEGTLNGNYDSLIVVPLPAPPPTLSSLSPTSGPVGTSVTISGSNFGATQGSSTVTFNGTAATPTSWSNTSIVAPVPSGTTTGPVVVTVGGAASNGVTFTVVTTGALAGTVTRTSDGTPINGALVEALQAGVVKGSAATTGNGSYSITGLAAGTYDLRVTASGYVTEVRTGISVVAGGTTSVNVALSLPGTLSGKVTRVDTTTPIPGAAIEVYQGAVLVKVATTNSTGDYTIGGLKQGTYTVQASAVGYVTKNQTGVTVTAGTTTTLNFSLDAAPANNTITYVYDELGRLTGVVDPAGETATYSYDAVGNLLSISRQSSNQVSIIEFTPNSGPVGTTVTIYGTGFSTTPSQNTVKFNGVTATVTSSTATQIITTVPSGATTGPIAVTTLTGSATSSTPFTVTASTQAPTITGFTPTIGNTGTAVNITGTNFEATPSNNKVTFNISQAIVSSATATTIGTTVPSNTGSGRISVTTPYGKAVSTQDFFIPPSPYTAADVEVTGRMAIGETKTVTITTANKIAMILFDGTAGQRVSLRMSSVTITDSDVYIYNPDGTTLGSDTSVGTSGDFIDQKTLPATGTYTILVDPVSSYTGSMTLTLYDAVDVTGTITPGGPSVTVTITVPGQNAKLTFSGTAGQRVSLGQSGGNCFSGNTGILNPDGTVLAGTCMGYFIDVQTLPVTGTYTVLVDPSGYNPAWTGSVTLTLYDASDITGTINIGGPAVKVTTTAPGQNARLTFSGASGQQVTVRVTNNTMSTVTVTLLKPDGTSLTSLTSSSSSFNLATQTLPTTGTYTISIDPSGTNTGSMDVSVTSP